MESDPTLAELLAAAHEFVTAVARREQADECFASHDVIIPAAKQLRLRADEMDRLDAQIRRARELLPKIDLALKEAKDA